MARVPGALELTHPDDATQALAEILRSTNDHMDHRGRLEHPAQACLQLLELGPMTDLGESDAPIFALVDDHLHSARLFTRTMRDTDGLAQVKWLGDADRAILELSQLLSDNDGNTPDLIVVDLKSHSAANEDFIARIAPHAKSAGVPVTAVVADLDAEKRHRLLEAGASAAFERHHDFDAYRREIEQISSFWVRETGTWPIRA
jgi:CheY-like chemotaxis protein